MITDILYTDHCIDDTPVTTVDPMDTFRKHFPVAAGGGNGPEVYSGGKILKYKMKFPGNANSWKHLAQVIIDAHNLPLEADTEEWSKGGGVFEVNLVIEYKPKY